MGPLHSGFYTIKKITTDGFTVYSNQWLERNGVVSGNYIVQLEDGGYSIAGHLGDRRTEYDIFLLRTPPDPNFTEINESHKGETLPIDFLAYPNPFNSSLRIAFNLPQKKGAKLHIYDITGRLAADLTRQLGSITGPQTVVWDAAGMPAGIYFSRLIVNEMMSEQRALLLK